MPEIERVEIRKIKTDNKDEDLKCWEYTIKANGTQYIIHSDTILGLEDLKKHITV